MNTATSSRRVYEIEEIFLNFIFWEMQLSFFMHSKVFHHHFENLATNFSLNVTIVSFEKNKDKKLQFISYILYIVIYFFNLNRLWRLFRGVTNKQ